MKYTVVWKPAAIDELAKIWMGSGDRREVAQATDAVDDLLRTNPLSQGESRSGNTRILLLSPLAVRYQVLVDDMLVEVLAIHRIVGRP